MDFQLINFDKNSENNKLFIDYAGDKIDQIEINGLNIDVAEFEWRNKLFLTIPNKYLNTGINNIVIRFTNLYVNNGHGLHSFIDTDGLQYLYSQGEPYYMNRIFPHFDQPDLKATMDLRIVGPNDWVIISNQSPITKRAFSLNIFEATITRRVPNL